MNTNHQYEKGYTLLELMISVGIVAIIAAIAIPAYNKQVSSAYISECTNEVSLIKLTEEEFFLNNNTYFSGNGVAALENNSLGIYVSTFTTPVAIANANCNFTVGPGTTGSIATSYNIVATGQNQLTPATVISQGN